MVCMFLIDAAWTLAGQEEERMCHIDGEIVSRVRGVSADGTVQVIRSWDMGRSTCWQIIHIRPNLLYRSTSSFWQLNRHRHNTLTPREHSNILVRYRHSYAPRSLATVAAKTESSHAFPTRLVFQTTSSGKDLYRLERKH